MKTYKAKFSTKTVTRKNNKEPKIAVAVTFENSFGKKIFKSSWGKDEKSAIKNLLNQFIKGSFVENNNIIINLENSLNPRVITLPFEIVQVEEV
jgi:hypothetical protein